MAKEPTEIEILFRKLADGTATAEELGRYFELSKDKALEPEIKALMNAEMSAADIGAEADRERLSKVYDAINKTIHSKAIVLRRSVWPRIAAAASIILVLGFGFYWYQHKQNTHSNQSSQYANDVSPGKQGATLTLASGQKINLTGAANGKLAEEAGVVISKTADGQLVYEIIASSTDANRTNTLSTANGETYKVGLPDGSIVWLNASSSLKYPASFAKLEKRRVELSGEAYFEVAKDKAHPFIVETKKQEVEVLGTHFNINSYSDEPLIATTLLEGSVKLISAKSKIVLKPGQQGLNDGESIDVVKTDIDKVTDWKDGDFNLNDLEFKAAMRKLARWYDIEVIYDKSVPDNIEAGGWISRNSKLSSVLKLIENSGLVKFKIEGKKVYVYR